MWSKLPLVSNRLFKWRRPWLAVMSGGLMVTMGVCWLDAMRSLSCERNPIKNPTQDMKAISETELTELLDKFHIGFPLMWKGDYTPLRRGYGLRRHENGTVDIVVAGNNTVVTGDQYCRLILANGQLADPTDQSIAKAEMLVLKKGPAFYALDFIHEKMVFFRIASSKEG